MGTNKANTIRAAKTAERILAMGGNDIVIVKRGASCVDSGAGRDTITVGTGKDHLFGGAGNDRLRAAGRTEYVNGGKGNDVAYVTAKGMKYAHRHSCEKVHRIRAKH
jgi:RTX calcium-binding nonapeptide repeat (4 copies)